MAQVVASLPPRWHGIDATSAHVGFVLDVVAGVLQVFSFLMPNSEGACGSVLVKGLYYKPEGHDF
jgi:hypothetical protein